MAEPNWSDERAEELERVRKRIADLEVLRGYMATHAVDQTALEEIDGFLKNARERERALTGDE